MRTATITEDQAISALPLRADSWLYNYVKWAAKQTDAPLAYHLGAGLCALAVTAPVNLTVTLAGPPLYANLFMLLAGRSGEDRKTTAGSMARGMLQAGAPGLIAPEPGSEQGFVDQLAIQPVQLLYFSEFGSFLAKAADGTYYEALKTRLNEAYDGGEIGRMKANGKGVRIESPRVTVLGACATPYLESYTTPVDWTGGFMGRWILLYAHRERLYSRGTAPPPALDAWLKAELYQRTIDAGQHGAGAWLGFTPEAERRWERWFAEVNERSLPEYVVGARARVPTAAVKIALVLAWDYGGVRGGAPWRIGLDVLDPAIAIAELHLQSVVALSETLAENRDMRDRRRVLNALRDGPLTFGEIMSRAKLLKKRCWEILDSVTEEGLVGRGDVHFSLLGGADVLAKKAGVDADDTRQLGRPAPLRSDPYSNGAGRPQEPPQSAEAPYPLPASGNGQDGPAAAADDGCGSW